jgi:hypothetical protein
VSNFFFFNINDSFFLVVNPSNELILVHVMKLCVCVCLLRDDE